MAVVDGFDYSLLIDTKRYSRHLELFDVMFPEHDIKLPNTDWELQKKLKKWKFLWQKNDFSQP